MTLPVPNRRALVLISGGLDSALAVRLMLDQDIEVVAVHFVNPFDDPSVSEGGRARRTAEKLGVPFHAIPKGEDFIDVLRHPAHGYGSAVNPCIDCRLYTFRKARQFMDEIGASFLVSGEVLGQRPMSQMRPQLDLIERGADVRGLLVRPLCAKHLAPTIPELDGRLDRERLLDISGRSRARQRELAARYDLMEVVFGAGGCLLTDQLYAVKVRDLYEHREEIALDDYRLLAMGRHLRADSETKLVLSRDAAESDKLLGFVKPGRIVAEPLSFAGPSVLWEGADSPRNLQRALLALAAFTKLKPQDRAPQQSVTLYRAGAEPVVHTFDWQDVPREAVAGWMLEA